MRRAGVDASWARPEGMHLTLKFLGDIDAGPAQAILAALPAALAGTGHFLIGLEGVGTFPNPRNARVVWAGVTGELAKLFELQAVVEETAAAAGIARERRPFTPHLTLGRVKQVRRPDQWLKALDGLRDFLFPDFDVDSISLMESELKPSGAVHREVGRVGL